MACLLALRLVLSALCLQIILSGPFDSGGRLQQVEFAQKAVEKGRGLVAVKTQEGVLLMTARAKDNTNPFSKPIEAGIKQIYRGPYFIGTGLVSDVHHLRQESFKFCTDHMNSYGTLPSILKLGSHLSELAYERSLSNEERPLGASCLLLQCVPLSSTPPSSSSTFSSSHTSFTAKILEVDVTGQCHDCIISCIGGLNIGTMVKHWPATDPHPTQMTLSDAREKVTALLQKVVAESDYSMDEIEYSFYCVDSENKLREITRSLDESTAGA